MKSVLLCYYLFLTEGFWAFRIERQSSVPSAGGAREASTSQGPATINVGLEFQPDFCGLRPLLAAGPSGRIVGGKDASRGQFPWQAQLWFKTTANSDSFFQCGGTLVSPNLVISAGHCFKSTNSSLYTLALGKILIGPENSECQEQIFQIERIEVHPRFNSKTLANDIALVWIKNKYNQSALFNDIVQPACLPDVETDPTAIYVPGRSVVVSGWGLLNETGIKGSQTLQFVSLPILTDTVCSKAYSQIINFDGSQQLCAGNTLGQDACSGDSGGPLVVELNGRHTLIGIVSFGKGCARAEYPGVYTKIHAHLPWIISKATPESLVVASTPSTIPVATTKATTTTTTTTTTTSTTTTTTKKTTTKATTVTTTTITTTTTTASTTAQPVRSQIVDGVDGGSSGPNSFAQQSQQQIIANAQVVGPICRGSFKLLSCPAPRTISIVKVFYGRQSAQYCTDDFLFVAQSSPNEQCSLENAEIYLKYMCDRRTSCWTYNELFLADPCPNTSKYSVVYYTCQ